MEEGRINMTVSSPPTLERISGIKSVSILRIDDSTDNSMILGDIFKQMSYQIVCAEGGRRASNTPDAVNLT